MNIPEKLLEVREYNKEGYSPVVDYCAWRVAVLNYSDQLLPQNLKAVQRHNETDDLLRGRSYCLSATGIKRSQGSLVLTWSRLSFIMLKNQRGIRIR